MSTSKIRDLFRSSKGMTVLFVTVGNSFRGDDGVGPYIARHLSFLKPPHSLLDIGDRPEDLLEQPFEINPQMIIIVDAADFGGEPGELRIIAPGAIPEKTLSTHTFPLGIIARLLQDDTGADVHFIGIQPLRMDHGTELSEPVRKAAQELIAMMGDLP